MENFQSKNTTNKQIEIIGEIIVLISIIQMGKNFLKNNNSSIKCSKKPNARIKNL